MTDKRRTPVAAEVAAGQMAARLRTTEPALDLGPQRRMTRAENKGTPNDPAWYKDDLPARTVRHLPLAGTGTPGTFVVYRGPSAFDGSQILAILTGVAGSSTNQKTGPMAQLWIERADMDPLAASAVGADVSVCGDCALRISLARGTKRLHCYVELGRAARQTWMSNHNAPVQLERAVDVLRGYRTPLRLGAYGDPAALPESVVSSLVRASPGTTAYTHAWRRPEAAWLKRYAMASCETPADYATAHAAGWRTFRVIDREGDPLFQRTGPRDPGEVVCPASTAELTRCIDCQLCDGMPGGLVRRSVAIVRHGSHVPRSTHQPATE